MAGKLDEIRQLCPGDIFAVFAIVCSQQLATVELNSIPFIHIHVQKK